MNSEYQKKFQEACDEVLSYPEGSIFKATEVVDKFAIDFDDFALYLIDLTLEHKLKMVFKHIDKFPCIWEEQLDLSKRDPTQIQVGFKRL